MLHMLARKQWGTVMIPNVNRLQQRFTQKKSQTRNTHQLSHTTTKQIIQILALSTHETRTDNTFNDELPNNSTLIFSLGTCQSKSTNHNTSPRPISNDQKFDLDFTAATELVNNNAIDIPWWIYEKPWTWNTSTEIHCAYQNQSS